MVEQNQKKGQKNTQKTYDSLQEAYRQQAEQWDIEAAYWDGIAKEDDVEKNGYGREEARQKALDARQNATDARAQSATYASGMSNENLDYLGKGLDTLKADAQEINDLINLKQA